LLRRVFWQKFADVSEVLAASIIRAMLEAASTSETSADFYRTTRHNNPEDRHLLIDFLSISNNALLLLM
jgi:hypothetical protein